MWRPICIEQPVSWLHYKSSNYGSFYTDPNLVVSSSTHYCSNVIITSDSPQEGPLTCSVMDNDLSSHTFLHGDRLVIDANTSCI